MNKLTKITFVASLIGILILLIIANQVDPALINIEDIEKSNLNQHVKIIGEIRNVRDLDGFQIVVVRDDTGMIDVLTNSEEPINKTDNNVVVIGKVSEYEGELQISANKIIEIED